MWDATTYQCGTQFDAEPRRERRPVLVRVDVLHPACAGGLFRFFEVRFQPQPGIRGGGSVVAGEDIAALDRRSARHKRQQSVGLQRTRHAGPDKVHVPGLRHGSGKDVEPKLVPEAPVAFTPAPAPVLPALEAGEESFPSLSIIKPKFGFLLSKGVRSLLQRGTNRTEAAVDARKPVLRRRSLGGGSLQMPVDFFAVRASEDVRQPFGDIYCAPS